MNLEGDITKIILSVFGNYSKSVKHIDKCMKKKRDYIYYLKEKETSFHKICIFVDYKRQFSLETSYHVIEKPSLLFESSQSYTVDEEY